MIIIRTQYLPLSSFGIEDSECSHQSSLPCLQNRTSMEDLRKAIAWASSRTDSKVGKRTRERRYGLDALPLPAVHIFYQVHCSSRGDF